MLAFAALGPGPFEKITVFHLTLTRASHRLETGRERERERERERDKERHREKEREREKRREKLSNE